MVSFSLKVFDLPALDELGDKPIEKILKFLQDFLNFTKKIDLNKPKVKVNCPTVENCVSGTEIFIIQRDMPFLVDSVRIELNRRGINIQTIKSTILNVIRSDDGTLVSAFATPEEPNSCKEALIFLSVEFHGSIEELLIVIFIPMKGAVDFWVFALLNEYCF